MKLLITGAWSCTQEQIEKIRDLGHEIDFLQQEKDKVKEPEKYDAVICNGLFLYHDIKTFVNLRYIQLTSAGFDRVPIDYIKKHDIKIYNARGVYSIPMAEFAIGGVLQIYKKSKFFYKNQTRKKWDKNREIIELYNKTVCIIGCGSTGEECAKRFAAFGCRVLGLDLVIKSNEHFEKIYPITQIDKILSISDIVLLTLPLTDQTRHLFNKDRFEICKTGMVLVNIARGGIVDTDALCDALDSKLSGAVIDVFEEEPLNEEASLWEYDNAIITPHNSFVSECNRDRLFSVIYENLKNVTRKDNICNHLETS